MELIEPTKIILLFNCNPNQIQGRRAKLSYNIDGVLLPCIRSFIRLIYPAGILPNVRSYVSGRRPPSNDNQLPLST